jgi:integrase
LKTRLYLHSKTYQDGRRPIYIDIRWGRESTAAAGVESRLRLGTQQSCQSSNWDAKKERVKTAERGANEINRQLTALSARVQQILTSANIEGRKLTPNELQQILRPKPVEELPAADRPPLRTLAVVVKDWQNHHRTRYSTHHLRKPDTIVNLLEGYRPGTLATDLKPDPVTRRSFILDEFCAYLVEEKKLLNSTIGHYLRIIRSLLKFESLPYEWVTDDYSEEVEMEPLTFEEVLKIYELQPAESIHSHRGPGNGLTQVRDLFVFDCFTGPRHQNLSKLRPEDVVEEELEDGTKVKVLTYIQFKRKRNKRPVRVVLNEIAEEIWNRYNGQLPSYTNQAMNRKVKVLAKQAGINRPVTKVRGIGSARKEEFKEMWELVTCHTGRRTFGSLLLSGGATLTDIQDGLGHASIMTTRRSYAKSGISQRHSATLNAFNSHRKPEEKDSGVPV